jgi:uncharacterized BrkB/YihY/UPF0761 family membrane protein
MEMNTQRNPFESPIISLGEWVLTLFITAIPIVGFVMLFVWGFGTETNPTKANFAKAALIMMVIGVVVWIVIFGAIFTAVISEMEM